MNHSNRGRELNCWLERNKVGALHATPYKTSLQQKGRKRLKSRFIRYRFPRRSEIISVLAIAVFVCFSWSIIGFFNQLSSFILYFSLAEIGAIFAYMMAFALLESLAVTGFLVLLSALLPSSWLKNGFAYKGFVILVIATIDAILFQKVLEDEYPSILILALFSIVPLVLIAILIRVLQSMPKVQNLLVNIQDRFLVLLFVYVPIGLVSLITVTVRNLL